MNSQFSAGPQALGYLYQARYSLFALLTDDRDNATLVIEGLDDIVVEGNSSIELDQLKHHINEVKSLTNYSPELWKTIRIWSEYLKNNDWQPEEVTLNLITTAIADENSAAAFLRYGKNRDEVKAYEQLIEVANNSTNQKLSPAFEAFKGLRGIQQERLIGAITIVDKSPNIQDIIAPIKKRLRLATSKEYVDLVYERLEGWWFDKVVTHLLPESNQPITQTELEEKIISIAEQFKRESLPIDFYHEEPPEAYFTNSDDRIFVQQLNQLKINAKRVRNALLDYYRAFEQRSRWVREKLYIDDELTLYEKRLKQEWSHYVARLEDDFDEFTTDEHYLSFGRKVLNWMETVDIPIRSQMPVGYEYATRGSYHILADLHPPEVYWHPKFLAYLDSVIAVK